MYPNGYPGGATAGQVHPSNEYDEVPPPYTPPPVPAPEPRDPPQQNDLVTAGVGAGLGAFAGTKLAGRNMAGETSTAGTSPEAGAGLEQALPRAGALAGDGAGGTEGALGGEILEGLEEFGALVVEDGGWLLLMSYKYKTSPHVEAWRALVRLHDEHHCGARMQSCPARSSSLGVTAIHQRTKARL
jgi:hypothetical protein